MITEDVILNFIPLRVSGTGFSASQFGLNLCSGSASGSGSVSGSGSGLRIPAFPYARACLASVSYGLADPLFAVNALGFEIANFFLLLKKKNGTTSSFSASVSSFK